MSEDPPVEVVKHILYGKPKDDICRFCYKPDNGTFVNIHDIVSIESEYYTGITTVAAMLKYMLQFEPESSDLPHILCKKCSNELLKFFLYKEKCCKIERYWKKAMILLSAQVNTDKVEIEIKAEPCYLKLDEMNSPSPYDRNSAKPVLPKMGIKECVACPQKYRSTREMHRHWKYHHPRLLPDCQYCGKVFTRPSTLRKHVEAHEIAENKYMCSMCDKSFAFKKNLEHHIKNMHGEKDLPCDRCPMKFATQTSLTQHKYRHHTENKSRKCKRCSKSFPNKDQLYRHNKKEHFTEIENKTSIICDKCGKVISNHLKLQLHLNTCEKAERNVICTICGATFHRNAGLTSHMRDVHPSKQYPCEICGKSFKTRVQMRSHLIVHTGVRAYKCATCLKGFVSKVALENHSRLHSGEKPFPCEYCDHRFPSFAQRNMHRKKKHGEPKLQCNICHNKFHLPYDLKKHLRRHLNPQTRLKCVVDRSLISTQTSEESQRLKKSDMKTNILR